MKQLSTQFKQFMLTTVFALVALFGFTVTNSFDNDYLMQAQIIKSKTQKTQKVASIEKKIVSKRLSTASFRVIK